MLRSASLVVIMATGVAAFAPAFSRFAGGMRRPLAASARMTRRVSSPLSLRAQLGDMPQVEADASGQELPEITEEMMLMMALEKRASSALPAQSKVIVFGALDRLGQLVVRHMVKDGTYKPALQVNADYTAKMSFLADGVEEEPDKFFPRGTSINIEEIPGDCAAGILCVEKDSDPDTLKQVLSLGLPLKKFVLLSRIGVDERESDWKLKMNPFLKLDRWAQIETTLKECADLYNFDYTIVRVGGLQGGPYFDTNRDFAAALDERIFDAEVKGVVLKEGDQPSLNTGRDVAAQCLVECLRQPDAANKVLSLVSVKGFREDGVACSVNNALDLGPASKNRAREVLTPSADEWKQAFSKGLP